MEKEIRYQLSPLDGAQAVFVCVYVKCWNLDILIPNIILKIWLVLTEATYSPD